jgi:hypothetical protein
MEAALLAVVLLFVAAVVFAVYAAARAVGAAKRGVDRRMAEARRSVEDTALRARSYGQPGVAGELAQLRLRLRTSMRATEEALLSGAERDPSLSESVRLFERLSVHGRELDDHLRFAERDPNRIRVNEHMAELRERTERITTSADSLRWAARDRARRLADDELATLSAEIDVESGALRHWTPATRPADPQDHTVGHAPQELGPADHLRGAWRTARTSWQKGQDKQEDRHPEATN